MKNSIINLSMLLTFLFLLTTHSFAQNTEFTYQVSNKANQEFIIQAKIKEKIIAEKIIMPTTDTSFSFTCSNDQLEDTLIIVSYDNHELKPLYEEKIWEYANPDVVARETRHPAERKIPTSSIFSEKLIYIKSLMPLKPIEQENVSLIKINLFIEEVIQEKHLEL